MAQKGSGSTPHGRSGNGHDDDGRAPRDPGSRRLSPEVYRRRRLVAALRDYADQVEAVDLGRDFSDSEQVRADLEAMGVDVPAARERLRLLLDRLDPVTP